MRKLLVASICTFSLLLAGCVVAGCGGGEDHAKLETACAKAKVAQAEYHRAGEAVGATFLEDKAGDRRVIAAAGRFREQVQALEPLTSSAQSQELVELVRVLVQHEKLIAALASHDLKTAHLYAGGNFEQTLGESQKHFEAICRTT
jgi:hypothetical protein